MNRKYSPEMRERALRMLAQARPEHPNAMSALRHVAGLLGRIKQLERESAELRKANEMADSTGQRNGCWEPDPPSRKPELRR